MGAERNLIYQKILGKGLKIDTCCEVGVYLPETSNVIDFINDNVETILVEPDPSSIAAIKEKFGDHKNVKLHEVAIFDKEGSITLSKAAASTFVSELPYSPATVNDRFNVEKSESYEVPCVRFSSIDSGEIDLLSIDTEGSEWYVLQDLRSEPKVISIETHGKLYVNPYITQIREWMEKNNYQVWFKDKSDTVYLKSNLASVDIGDKISLMKMNFKLGMNRLIKRIARAFTNK